MLTLFTRSEVHRRWQESLVQEVARHVAIDSMPLMGPATGGMNPAELRGYVRSRVMGMVVEQASECIRDLRLRRRIEKGFTAAVLERVIHLVVRDLSSKPVRVLPQPHVRLFKAA